MITVENGAASRRVAEAVLFPFDSYSIPFTAGLRMQWNHSRSIPWLVLLLRVGVRAFARFRRRPSPWVLPSGTGDDALHYHFR